MGNKVTFNKARIWRNDYTTDNGEFSTYSISIPRQNKDKSWTYAKLKTKFAQSANAPEKISNGTTADLEGFLTVDSFTTKEGKEVTQPMLMVMSLNIDTDEEYDSFELAEDEIPF